MEIMVQKETLATRDTLAHLAAELLSESDTIVPDAMPDIGEILEVSARARITSCRAQGDRILVGGVTCFTVLYVPDGDEGEKMVESLSVEVPFKDVISCPPSDGAEIAASLEVVSASGLLLNSRKLSVKGVLALSVLLTKPRVLALSTDAEAEAPMGIRRTKILAESDGGGGVFTVTASATEEVPPEKPAILSVLKTDAHIIEEDVRLVTGKMIVKGAVRLMTLYTGDTPSCAPVSMFHSIPFTEILDLPGTEEGMAYTLDYSVSDIYFEADTDGGRRFGAEVTMEFRARTRKTEEIEILEDCYCPGYKTEVVKAPIRLKSTRNVGNEGVTVRKVLTLPPEYPPIFSVCALSATPAVTSVSLDGQKAEVEGEFLVSLLYLSDGEEAACAYKDRVPFSVSFETDAAESAEISARARLLDAGFTLPDSGSVDVRVNLSVDLSLSEEHTVDTVSEVRVLENDGEKRPSVVIAFTAPGDTLWSLGKKYGVAAKKIAAFNRLDEHAPLSAGMRLLVP